MPVVRLAHRAILPRGRLRSSRRGAAAPRATYPQIAQMTRIRSARLRFTVRGSRKGSRKLRKSVRGPLAP